MNQIIDSIPIAQYYNTEFDEIRQLDNKGRLYLPRNLIGFQIPVKSKLVLIQDSYIQPTQNFLFGFIIKNNLEIERKLTEIYTDELLEFDDIYSFVRAHILDSENRAEIRDRLEETLGKVEEFRLRGMGKYFLIENI